MSATIEYVREMIQRHPDWPDAVNDKGGAAALAELDAAEADGWEVMPVGHCDNFDRKKGCLGHPIVETEGA